MQITVRFGEPLWRSVNAFRITLHCDQEVVTVALLLAELAARYPAFEHAYRGDDLGHVMPYQVFVNAQRVPPGEEGNYRLADGDKVHILLPAAGGAIMAPLPAEFYQRPTLEVARGLLGQRLVRELGGHRLCGRITEVEAYIGEDDLASHARYGPTSRNRSMYGRPGTAYVYLIYGMYHCLNVVTENAGFPAAVLIRQLIPEEGIEMMAARRLGRPRSRLADGPGKLCQALAIDRTWDGHDLTEGVSLWLEPGPSPTTGAITATPRINVSGDDRARHIPWRFLIRPD